VPGKINSTVAAVLLCCAVCPTTVFGQDTKIDASDPTKIYTYAGGGLKYVEYTNGESMIEVRATGNLGLSDSDMILAELGYGWHDGDLVAGKSRGMTNARVRWFHLFNMDYDKARGYRGMGTQLDIQLAGELKGTDGQNVVAAGIMPAYALSDEWSLFLMLNVVSAWDKDFKKYSGTGVGIAPKLVFSTERWWPGAQIQVTPNIKEFFSGALEGEGDITLEMNVGGEFSPTLMWDFVVEKNFELDLTSLKRGVGTGLKGDWNLFFNVTTYF
jgi:hypothetical protein